MASTNSVKTLSDVLASLSVTMSNFQTESSKVEADFFALVEGLREGSNRVLDIGEHAGPHVSQEHLQAVGDERDPLLQVGRGMVEPRDAGV